MGRCGGKAYWKEVGASLHEKFSTFNLWLIRDVTVNCHFGVVGKYPNGREVSY